MILNPIVGTHDLSQRYRPIGESKTSMMNNLNGSSCWGTESNINIEGGPYGTHEYCSKAFERLGKYASRESQNHYAYGAQVRVSYG